MAGQTRRRRSTSTSNFGAGRRESHDSTPFYDRFRPPELSDDNHVPPPADVADPFVCGDARRMEAIGDGTVALVVTSPPYFAGKQYEEELERDGVPSSYLEYLTLLTDVFAQCVRKLEPGGRIAVNVANLGRKPYRSLSADVIRILEHELGLLLRGELIWQKAQGATGSCAWGSFRSAANPVLRDLTERVIVASKGRFDRAKAVKQRKAEGLPHQSTLMTDDFMALTLDLWDIPPESARRVGHPAPFPVELPEQLIRLYTFADDLVLDPFMGSGSALVAAARLGRRYIGYDVDPDYVETARHRVAAALEAPDAAAQPGPGGAAAGSDGKSARTLAREVLEAAGFTIVAESRRIRGTGVTIDWVAADGEGQPWHVAVPGGFTSYRGGLSRTSTVWAWLGKASALKGAGSTEPLLFLTTALPHPRSEGDLALRAAGPTAFFDVISMLGDGDRARLQRYAKGNASEAPLPGFWTASDLQKLSGAGSPRLPF
jgi:site-specific DNA-methyltransferase (adenine-specific)